MFCSTVDCLNIASRERAAERNCRYMFVAGRLNALLLANANATGWATDPAVGPMHVHALLEKQAKSRLWPCLIRTIGAWLGPHAARPTHWSILSFGAPIDPVHFQDCTEGPCGQDIQWHPCRSCVWERGPFSRKATCVFDEATKRGE